MKKGNKSKRFFQQVVAIAVTDAVTSHLIPIVYALEADGSIYRKIYAKPWELITDDEYFEKHEQDINHDPT